MLNEDNNIPDIGEIIAANFFFNPDDLSSFKTYEVVEIMKTGIKLRDILMEGLLNIMRTNKRFKKYRVVVNLGIRKKNE